jgi:DNA anti-recombination protein RmuC
VWDLRNEQGVTLPPGEYQVRLKSGIGTFTQPLNVLIDPRIAADGVTIADLQEQFEHNMRMRELVSGINQLATRVRDAQNKLRNGSDPNTAARVDAIAAKLLTEPVRYGKPGLQAHVTYLASMTANVDQKIGRDAIERYGVLKKEFDALRAEVDQVLGANSSTNNTTPE